MTLAHFCKTVRTTRWLVLLVACGAALGCHSTAQPDAPGPFTPPATLVGTWVGTMTDNPGGQGAFTMTVNASGNEPNPWRVTFQASSASGTVITSPDGAVTQLLILCSSGGSAFGRATLARDRMSITYDSLNCPALGHGTADVSRQ